MSEALCDEIKRLTAENERLRKTLRHIGNGLKEGPPKSDWQGGYNAAARDAVRCLKSLESAND